MWSTRLLTASKLQQLSAVKRVVSRSFNNTKAVRGGDGHSSHSHGPREPYAPHHHQTYPDKAHLFGIDPSVPYKSEGWEWITLITYVLSFGIVATAYSSKPLDAFNSWAKEEALARQKVRENGGEIEFGKVYNKVAFTDNEEDEFAMPVEKVEE